MGFLCSPAGVLPFGNGRLALWSRMLVTQSCLTLCDPTDCSPPGSSVHGILQARILKWIAVPFSRVSSWPRDWTEVFCLAGGFFTSWTTRKALHQERPANSSHTALQVQGDSTRSQGKNLILDHLMVERLFVNDLQEENMCHWKGRESEVWHFEVRGKHEGWPRSLASTTGNGQSERNEKSACHAEEGHSRPAASWPHPSFCPYSKVHVFLESHQAELSFLSYYAELLLHSSTGSLAHVAWSSNYSSLCPIFSTKS